MISARCDLRNWLACKESDQAWLQLHVPVAVTKLSPVVLGLTATAPGPELPILFDSQRMEVTACDLTDPTVLKGSQYASECRGARLLHRRS